MPDPSHAQEIPWAALVVALTSVLSALGGGLAVLVNNVKRRKVVDRKINDVRAPLIEKIKALRMEKAALEKKLYGNLRAERTRHYDDEA